MKFWLLKGKNAIIEHEYQGLWGFSHKSSHQNLRLKIIFGVKSNMRVLFKQQLTLSAFTEKELIGRLHTRDDIDKLALGFNEILKTPTLRNIILEKLQEQLNLSNNLGREGMDYWSIFVFGVTRVSLDLDYDRLQNLANNHAALRSIVGHGALDGHKRYSITTLKDNIRLLSEDLLDEINTLIVTHGQNAIHPYSKNKTLNCRGDSYVAKTNVHYPTDINLLYDAVRKIIEIVAQTCQANNIAGTRQYKHNRDALKTLMHRARKSKKAKNIETTKNAHQLYINFAFQLLEKAKAQLTLIAAEGVFPLQKQALENYQTYADKFIDQINRRVINGEIIPHQEKVFSIFEPHTEWVSKGKAGIPVEFGIKLAVVQDQHQFILHHHVMENKQDVHVAVEVAKEVHKRYGEIDSMSFDRGFWSPENEIELSKIVCKVVMPKKGYRNKERQDTESEKEFKKLRHRHSAVESGINDLQVHGLEKVPDRGIEGYKRYVSIGIVGYNVHLLGGMLLHKHYKDERKRAA